MQAHEFDGTEHSSRNEYYIVVKYKELTTDTDETTHATFRFHGNIGGRSTEGNVTIIMDADGRHIGHDINFKTPGSTEDDIQTILNCFETLEV